MGIVSTKVRLHIGGDQRAGHALLLAIVFCAISICMDGKLLWAQSPSNADDPFYGQKGQFGQVDTSQLLAEGTKAVFQQVQENVNPFTGNLSLVHTDVVLPGNGGLDLKVQRVYNSRIWGRRDTSFPGVVAFNERSIMGLGWSFHFGRVRNPWGTGSQNPTIQNNPVVEMSDGSQHPLYVDKNNSSRKVSLEQWLYTQSGNSFLLTLTDGTVYEFASANQYGMSDGTVVWQVSKITSPNGNMIQFTYNASDPRLVTSVTDSVGRQITFSYSTISNPAQCTITYTALTSMTANGQVHTYVYEPLSSAKLCHLFLQEVRPPSPPSTPSWTYTYGSTDPGKFELLTATSPYGAVYSYTYGDIAFNVGEPALPNGVQFSVVTTRTLSGGGLPSTTWTYAYGPPTFGQNQVTTVTQSGCNRTERFTFHSFGTVGAGNIWRVGLVLKKEILNGSTVVQQEDYTWSPSTFISNDGRSAGLWGPTPITDTQIFMPLLTARTITRDGRTYTTTYSNHNAYGEPQTISETGNLSRTTALTYYTDTAKNIARGYPATEQVTVAGQSFNSSFQYDGNGNLSVLNRYGVQTTFTYFNGNRASRTDHNGHRTEYVYEFGRVSQITNPIYTITRQISWFGNIESETNGRGHLTDFSYDNLNRITQVTPPSGYGSPTTVSYNDASRTRTITRGSYSTTSTLDGLERVIGTNATGGILTTTTYNECGQRSYQSYPYTSSNIGDSYTYDVLDRVTQILRPDGSVTYNYGNGNVIITNERAISTTYNNTAFGNPDEKRLASVVDNVGTTSYTYNAVGSLTGITQGGFTRSFSYDTKNFLVSETHPETGNWTYGRDLVGNLTSKTDGKGTTNYGYDALNRLLTIDYPGGTQDDTSLIYDNADNRTRVSSSAATIDLTYDPANRLTQQIVTMGAPTYLTNYSYDGSDNLTDLTYPTGRSIHYTYDSANRVSGLTGYVTNVTYHPSRGMAGFDYANGTHTTIGYDDRYRVQALNTTLGAATLRQHTYNYDGASNVLGITDGMDANRTRTMTYDAVDRLSTANGIWGTLSFDYSPVGNRISQILNGTATTTYGYDGANRLTSLSGAQTDTLTYDGNGNVTSLRGLALTYDFANRLTTVNGTAVTYTYNGDGQRIKKVNSATGKTVLYHYDWAGNLLAETDATGAPLVEYLYLNGQLTARIETDTTVPIITNINKNPSDRAATITWTTDEAADSQVEYGLTSALGTNSTLDPVRVTSHSVVLTDLTPSTTYYFIVKSRDAAGNLATSVSDTFTTTAVDTTPPTLSNISSGTPTATSATITWTTDELADSQVEYGLTTAYGSSSQVTTPVLNHSVTINGLTHNTVYHYRVKSQDAAGNLATSSDATFTTAAADTTPPTLSNISSGTPTDTTATITWSTAGPPSELADSQVEYGTTIAYGSVMPLDPTMVTNHSMILRGLTPGTLYHYRVKSQDASGNLATSADATFTTATADTTPPTLSGISHGTPSTTSAIISWNTTGESSDTQVEYGTTPSYGSFSLLNTAFITSHNVTLQGLWPSTTYYYRVRSRDAAGNLATGTGSFTTASPPAWTLTAIPGASTINLHWQLPGPACPPETELLAYRIDYCEGSSCTPTFRPFEPFTSIFVPTPTNIYTFTTQPGHTFRFQVKGCTDLMTNVATTTTFAPDTTSPTIGQVMVPSGMLTTTSATIKWATNEASNSQVSYGLTSGLGSNSPSSPDPANVFTHSVMLTGLMPNTTYHYVVKSQDAAGNLATSTDATFKTLPDTTPPVAPTALTGADVANDQGGAVTVSWTPSSSADVVEQRIYRATASGGPYGLVKTVAGNNATSTTVTGLPNGVPGYFVIRAFDGTHASVNSNEISITPLDNLAPEISGVSASPVTETTATINWTTDETADSQVEYGLTTAYGTSSTLDPAYVTTHSVVLSGLTSNTTYHYRVLSRDAAGNLASSTDFSFVTLLAAPVNLSATTTGLTQVALTWDALAGMTEYEVQRSTNNSQFTQVGLPTTNSFTDSTVSNGITYFYRVRARNGTGPWSEFSDTDLATTILFADDPLVAATTVIKAQHVTELRQAVNAVRASAGLAAATWTDPALTVGVTQINAVHVQELRTNLDQARSALGLSALSYSDPTLTVGTTAVKKAHVDELRQGVK